MGFYSSREWLDASMGSPGGKNALQWMIEQAKIPDGGAMLDLCCGQGKSVWYLAEMGYRVIGIDCAKEAIERIRQKEGKLQIQAWVGDARVLDLPECSQDGVVCQCSLSLFDDEIPRVLREIHRVLQPRGFLLLADLYWKEQSPKRWKQELAGEGFVLKQWKDISEELRAYRAEYVWKTGKLFPACKVKSKELGYFLSVWRCIEWR